jgi:DNA-dependent RNA polymerase auxiliary subunit epsilon
LGDYFYNLPYVDLDCGDDPIEQTVHLYIKNNSTSTDLDLLIEEQYDIENFITYSADNITYADTLIIGDILASEIKDLYVKQTVNASASLTGNPRSAYISMRYRITST